MSRSDRRFHRFHNVALVCAIAAVWGFAFRVWPASQESIVSSPHNLSLSGPGPVKSLSETEICIFCHVPHRAGVPPLWNRELSQAGYITYKSSTAKAQPGQPTGASKLCLSCHDGTIAVGRLLSRPGGAPMGTAERIRGRKNLGTDLSNDHPISMSYSQAQTGRPGGFKALPGPYGPVALDPTGQVQCTSCHDPHNNGYGDFLVMDNREGRLCLMCHDVRNWGSCSHNLSTARWNGAGPNPWPYTPYEDVHTNACANCHTMHDAGGPEHLLYYLKEADTCYSCHNGSVAPKDLRRDFESPFRHRVEAAIGSRPKPTGREYRVTRSGCTDCHNPHAANTMDGVKPNVSGALAGVSGMSATGGIMSEARYEYEVCYKCHSAAAEYSVTRLIRRDRMFSSLRDKFNPSAASFHPVQGVGRNANVPSLIPPLSPSSLVSCTDCHRTDSAGPNAVMGPHGSKNRFLLALPYQTGDMVTESQQAYALCYECHDRMSIISDRSFTEHNRHVVRVRAPCSVCHDAHGISRSEGTFVHNAHLINFDTTVVRRDLVTQRLEYTAEGFQKGACYLSCHGVNHSPHSY